MESTQFSDNFLSSASSSLIRLRKFYLNDFSITLKSIPRFGIISTQRWQSHTASDVKPERLKMYSLDSCYLCLQHKWEALVYWIEYAQYNVISDEVGDTNRCLTMTGSLHLCKTGCTCMQYHKPQERTDILSIVFKMEVILLLQIGQGDHKV